MRLLPPDSRAGWTPYVWLIYLGTYLGFPLVLGATTTAWLVCAAGLVAFLPLYFAGYWIDGARRLPVIVAITALGMALVRVNPGASVFFVYATSFVGGSRTGRAAVLWIVGITVVGLAAAWTDDPWALFALVFVAVFAPLIGFINVHDAEVRRHDASLRMAHGEIARLAALAERDRIAGELHDLLGHSLSVIALKSDLAARIVGRDPERAAREMADAARVSREALAEVRQVVQGVRISTLADEIARARSVLRTAGVEPLVEPEVGAEEVVGSLVREREHALALALREAVTNVVRHARATRCRITVSRDGDGVRLLVEDDGRGGALVEGSGLAGMRRRVEAAGGGVDLRSDEGVRLVVSMPVAPGGAGA